MLQFPTWKMATVILVCLAGVVFSAPNIFYSTVEQANDARAAIEAGRDDPALQAQAEAWPDWAPSDLVNLGLDLRGGAHLLVEVHVEDVYAERMNALWPEARGALRDLRDQVGAFRRVGDRPDALEIRLDQAAGADALGGDDRVPGDVDGDVVGPRAGVAGPAVRGRAHHHLARGDRGGGPPVDLGRGQADHAAAAGAGRARRSGARKAARAGAGGRSARRAA